MTDQEFEEFAKDFKPFWYWYFYRQLHPLPKELVVISLQHFVLFAYYIVFTLLEVQGNCIYVYIPYADAISKGYPPLPEEPFTHHAERSPH